MNNLNYEILFIEDNDDVVRSTSLLIKRFLDELGFKSNIYHKKGKEFDANKIKDSIDLILLDLNLKDKILGSELIIKIRENHNISDILFYSDDLINYDKQLKMLGNVDGVFFCRGRKNMFPKLKKLIIKSIKKHQTVSNLRGLVISEAIDLESKMSKIIIKFFGLLSHPREDLFYEKILDPEIFMLGKKSMLMGSICKQIKKELTNKIGQNTEGNIEKIKQILEAINKIHDECKKIDDEVLKVRNILSHVEQSKENPAILTSVLPKYKTITINHDWCVKTRKDLMKHSTNLDKLLEIIF
jgi:hypothetical protein